jgi:hypothetical protein
MVTRPYFKISPHEKWRNLISPYERGCVEISLYQLYHVQALSLASNQDLVVVTNYVSAPTLITLIGLEFNCLSDTFMVGCETTVSVVALYVLSSSCLRFIIE